MLSQLQKGMGDVRASAPTYQDLISLYYLKKMLLVEKDLTTEDKFHIFKNFCRIYKSIHSNEDVVSFMAKVKKFRKDLKSNAVRVEDLKNQRKRRQESIAKGALREFARGLFLLPFFTFFIPIRKILISIAERKRVQALSNSVVKGRL